MLNSALVHAQEEFIDSEIDKTTQQKAIGLLSKMKYMYPGLGMVPVDLSGNKKTVMSTNGRYIIRGEIKDLWSGSMKMGRVKIDMQKLPTHINKSDYFLSFGTGELHRDVFLTFSCLGCIQTMESIFTTENLNKYTFHILPLSNSASDQVLIDQMYCANDPKVYFKRVFVNRDLRKMMTSQCDTYQSKMNNALATALAVRALPMMYDPLTSIAVIGNASAAL
jgi:hypothetical protein